jgi:signal transduction histidine kinase
MIDLSRLPVRWRVTLAFSLAMGFLFAVIGTVLYLRLSETMLDELDTGLRSRAAALQAGVHDGSLSSVKPARGLIEPEEVLTDVVRIEKGTARSILRNTPPALEGSTLEKVRTQTFFERKLDGIQGTARLLAVPVESQGGPVMILVGASMQDRRDALNLMIGMIAVGGPIALALASAAGWIAAGVALRPVEGMRRQADAISISGLDRRLPEPVTNDEVGRLAHTLNQMLQRLQESFSSQRRVLDHASHELRTPLAVLKAELDLARSRPRSQEELSEALMNASLETDRLVRLAEDLLVLSRAQQGRLQFQRARVHLDDLVSGAARRFGPRAEPAGINLKAHGDSADVMVDDLRVGQALDNLLDNAFRHTPAGGTVELHGSVDDGVLRIVVEDSGAGFPEGFEDLAFEAFEKGKGQSPGSGYGAGLGLAIVRAVAEGHGGHVHAENRAEGGARVVLTLRTGNDPAFA